MLIDVRSDFTCVNLKLPGRTSQSARESVLTGFATVLKPLL
jgi:hypothetical protein